MNTYDYQALIPSGFPDDAKVWIFQSSRPFGEREELEINEQLLQFYSQWQAHGAPVKGWATLIYQRFIVVMADEAGSTQVSGCSTDSMFRVIKSIERQYNVNMFDRMALTFLVKGKAEMLPMQQVQYALDKGFLQADSLLFNNLVDNKKDWSETWLQPLHESWLKDRVQLKDSHFSEN